jgi:hypothetical protein
LKDGVAGSGVVPGTVAPSQGAPGLSSSPMNASGAGPVQGTNAKAEAQKHFAQLLNAKNECLGLMMSQLELETNIAENLVDWEAANPTSNGDHSLGYCMGSPRGNLGPPAPRG